MAVSYNLILKSEKLIVNEITKLWRTVFVVAWFFNLQQHIEQEA